jgi:predicted RNA-binding protein with RPS1 domain
MSNIINIYNILFYMTINQVYPCKVIKIQRSFVLVSYKNITGICHISEISDYLVHNIRDFLTLDSTYDFLLIYANELNKKYIFSFKRIRSKLLKSHSHIIPTVSGYANLYKYVLDLIE